MNRQENHELRGICRIDAWGAADPWGLEASPASLLIDVGQRGIKVLASGAPEKVERHRGARRANRVDLADHVLIPGLVNAHTHLDLTHIGPQPHDAADGFVAWVDRIREGRHVDDEQIAVSVRRGIELCLAGGTLAVGDISGSAGGRHSLAPLRELRRSKLRGASFLEFFAIGRMERPALERLRVFLKKHRDELTARQGVWFGLQPHAPYSVSLEAYRVAAELASQANWPLTTHLAETPEEREFVARGTGPQRALLERLGVWDDAILETIGKGRSPVDHMAERLGSIDLAAHINDVDDAGIARLHEAGVTVVYCPRASAYFGAPDRFGPHRYQDMMANGVHVALGTDSIVNLPASAADPEQGGISVLDEMRLLCRRDGLDPRTALRMGSINGGAAFGIGPKGFSLSRGGVPMGLVGVKVDCKGDPLGAVMRSDEPARLLAGPISVESE